MATNPSAVARVRRKAHIRKKVRGTTERPRLCVFRSAQHIYAQLIDDSRGVTLVAASSLVDLGDFDGHRGNSSAAKAVGEVVGRRAVEAGFSSVCFDRNGFLYHGRVKALADGARSVGLDF